MGIPGVVQPLWSQFPLIYVGAGVSKPRPNLDLDDVASEGVTQVAQPDEVTDHYNPPVTLPICHL